MRSLNFIGGEKGGVGKSVVARALAQYYIDRGRPFTGFDTDRSHNTFARFYADYAAPVVVDRYEGLDQIALPFEDLPEDGPAASVIVDLAAQTAAPLARWIKESDLLELLAELGVKVNFWHLADAGKDSIELLGKLLDTYGEGPNYVVVKNHGRGTDFSQLEESPELAAALAQGARVINLPELHEASMRKIDRQDASFWAAINQRSGDNALGMLERQRVKSWLKTVHASFDGLAV